MGVECLVGGGGEARRLRLRPLGRDLDRAGLARRRGEIDKAVAHILARLDRWRMIGLVGNGERCAVLEHPCRCGSEQCVGYIVAKASRKKLLSLVRNQNKDSPTKGD